MKSLLLAIVILQAGITGVSRSEEQPLKITDPAPPKVTPLPASPKVPDAKARSQVTAFSKPKSITSKTAVHHWESFLGPTHNNVSADTYLIKDLSLLKQKNGSPQPVWQLTRGPGLSAPVISGKHLVFFHRTRDTMILDCMHSESGNSYWTFTFPATFKDTHRFGYGLGPKSSPVISRNRVFAYGPNGLFHCLDIRTGKLLWKRDLLSEFKGNPGFFGVSTAPLVEDDVVIINVGGKGGPGVVGLDIATGKLRWGCDTQWGASYASPVPAVIHGKRVVFVFSGGKTKPPVGGLICLDPKTGTIHFRFPFRSKTYSSVNASSPVITGNSVFISTQYGTGGVLLEIATDFSFKTTSKTKFGSEWMTPIIHEGHLYGVTKKSIACVELASGTIRWQKRPSWPYAKAIGNRTKSSLGRSSLIRVDGDFLCLGEWGDLCWLKLTPAGLSVISKTKLFHAKLSWTSPVLCNGLLYICQNRKDSEQTPPRLLCYDLRAR